MSDPKLAECGELWGLTPIITQPSAGLIHDHVSEKISTELYYTYYII